jgi:hypothetical protein
LHKPGGPVDLIGDSHAPPVQGGRLVEPVDQPRPDLLPQFDTQQRAGRIAAKAPDLGRRGGSRQKREGSGAGFQNRVPVRILGLRPAGKREQAGDGGAEKDAAVCDHRA